MAPNATELETAPRLRGIVGKLARLLRRTDALGTGLTPTRVAVLLTVDRHGPLRLAQVAEREGLNPTLLSRTVAELLTDQLVTRTSDPEDRRSAWVQVTDAGHTLADQLRAQRTAAVQGAIDDLDAADRSLIEAALPALERLAQTLADAPVAPHQLSSGRPVAPHQLSSGRPVAPHQLSSGRPVARDGVSSGRPVARDGVSSDRTVARDGFSSGAPLTRDDSR